MGTEGGTFGESRLCWRPPNELWTRARRLRRAQATRFPDSSIGLQGRRLSTCTTRVPSASVRSSTVCVEGGRLGGVPVNGTGWAVRGLARAARRAPEADERLAAE